jgi:glycosyltransferase involved in cell wall biosynthesis
VVGDGPLRAHLECHAASLGLTGTVTFTGFRSDVLQLIADPDVLVVPSRSDGSPLVVCEAMAAGVPVVASRVGGLPDLVAHGDSGLLVPAEDPDALARTLAGLLLRPAAAQALGARGRQLAAARSHARLVDRMTEVCAAVAGGRAEVQGVRSPSALR